MTWDQSSCFVKKISFPLGSEFSRVPSRPPLVDLFQAPMEWLWRLNHGLEPAGFLCVGSASKICLCLFIVHFGVSWSGFQVLAAFQGADSCLGFLPSLPGCLFCASARRLTRLRLGRVNFWFWRATLWSLLASPRSGQVGCPAGCLNSSDHTHLEAALSPLFLCQTRTTSS